MVATKCCSAYVTSHVCGTFDISREITPVGKSWTGIDGLRVLRIGNCAAFQMIESHLRNKTQRRIKAA